jgi:hypothetical protein
MPYKYALKPDIFTGCNRGDNKASHNIEKDHHGQKEKGRCGKGPQQQKFHQAHNKEHKR